MGRKHLQSHTKQGCHIKIEYRINYQLSNIKYRHNHNHEQNILQLLSPSP